MYPPHLDRHLTDGRLSHDQIIRAADHTDPLFDLVETALKGPEVALPDGYAFFDKGGDKRENMRCKWWDRDADTWRKIALSVPDPAALPDTHLPDGIKHGSYPDDAPPVFFGHYWLEGTPVLQSDNALRLDYSAGLGGPFVSYCATPFARDLSSENITIHA